MDLHQVTRIKVPNQGWKLDRASADLDSVFLYEMTGGLDGGHLSVNKSMKINLKSKKIEYQILNLPYTSAAYPQDFTEIEGLQASIDQFAKAALCPGIVDEKYHTIKHIQIGTGSFDTGVWRSST